MSVPFVIENVEPVVAGSTITYSLTWLGISGSGASSPAATVYLSDGTEITSTVMASGSHSITTASPPVQTLKPIAFQSTHGNTTYIVNVQAVVGGNTEIAKFQVRVLEPKEAF